MELASLPETILEDLIGDCVTDGLPEILYNTYNGDLELLKKSILDKKIDEFARTAMLRVMGQLYLDKKLGEEEWKAFLKQIVYQVKEADNIHNEEAVLICGCHFVEMLPEIRYLLKEELLDEIYMGKYNSCVDAMFQYREFEKNFCQSPIKAADMLKSWAMFEKNETEHKEMDKAFRELLKEAAQDKNPPKVKIGRNDPCPCGSGKKYKFCCMNKPKSPLDSIESPEERQKWLRIILM